MATIEINPLESLVIVLGLEEECNICGKEHLRSGAPQIPYSKWLAARQSRCDVCSGKGYTLTDAGRALIAFLERWKG